MSRDIIQFSCLEEKIDVSLFNKREARVKCTCVSLLRVHTWEVSIFLHVFCTKAVAARFQAKPTVIELGNFLRGILNTDEVFFFFVQEPVNWLRYDCEIHLDLCD